MISFGSWKDRVKALKERFSDRIERLLEQAGLVHRDD